MSPCKITAITNQKGGKTTTTSSFNFRFIPDQCGDMDAKEMRSKLKDIRECAVHICGDMTQYLEKVQKQPKSTEVR